MPDDLLRRVAFQLGQPRGGLDHSAAFDSAAGLAERFGATGETDSVGYLFGPVDLGMCRMHRALDADEPDQAAGITKFRRSPVVREVLAGLLTRVRRDAVSKELRRMAFRAGLTT